MFNNDPYATYKFECNPDCPDRKVGCRTGCERYARDVALRDKIKEARAKERPYADYTCDKIQKRITEKARKSKVKFKINNGR